MGKIYNIICYSKFRFFLLMFGCILSSFPIGFFFFRFGLIGIIILCILMLTVLMMCLFVFPKYVAKKVLQISINEENIRFITEKPYWGNKKQEDLSIKVEDIKSLHSDGFNQFETLKIYLKSKQKITIHRWYLDCNDDFDKFYSHLNRMIISYNKKKKQIEEIPQKEDAWDNKYFLIAISLVLLLIMTVFIVLTITKGIENINLKSLIPLLIVAGPLTFIVKRIIHKFKQ